MAYLSPWVATKERMPEEGQEVLAKCWKPEGYDRFYMYSCIFKKEYGIHQDAFVLSAPAITENGYVIHNVICWMPTPPHGDSNGEEWNEKI